MNDLRRRMAKGAAWMILARLGDRSIGVISTLFLARLLVPADFGLVAMAMSLIGALEILSAFNFDVSLIRTKNATDAHYNTAWTFNVITGVVNACLLQLLAEPAAQFFHEPRVEIIARWLSLYSFVQGFANIGVVAFQKELQFHREFQLGMARRLASLGVTLTLAFTLRSYWALVVGSIFSSFVTVLLSYRMHPYRPRFDLSARHELFGFSKWMLVNNVLTYLIHRSTDLVLGRATGSQALGTYNVAYEISNLPTTELVFPITRAVFPGYSQMAHSAAEIRKGFLDVLSVLLLFVIPAGFGIWAIADPIVNVLLGPKWAEAIPLIQLLSIFGVLRAATSNTGAVYMALGVPRLLTYLSVLYLVLMGTAFYFLVPSLGALGAAYSVLFAASIQIPIGFVVLCRTIDLPLTGLLGAVWRPLAAAGLMAAAIVGLHRWWAAANVNQLVQLLVLVPLGAFLYVSATLALWALAGRPAGGEAHILPIARAAASRLRLVRNAAS
jgi:O-antigen/teichoic acid export membrane protein